MLKSLSLKIICQNGRELKTLRLRNLKTALNEPFFLSKDLIYFLHSGLSVYNYVRKLITAPARKQVLKMKFPFMFVTLLVLFCLQQDLVRNAIAKAASVTITSLQAEQKEGRLHLMFSSSMEQEPRLYNAWPTKDIEPLFSRDLAGLSNGQTITFDASTKGFPFDSLADVPAGKWYVQAIYDSDFLDSRINSPLNVYSDVVEFENDAEFSSICLSLAEFMLICLN